MRDKEKEMRRLMANDPLVAANPRIRQVRFALWIEISLVLCILVSGASWVLQTFHFVPAVGWPFLEPEAALVMSLPASLLALHAPLLHCLRRVDQRRRAAAAGDRRWLVTIQPVPTPRTGWHREAITLRLKKTYIWFWTGFCFFVFLVGGSLPSVLERRFPEDLPFLGLTVLCFLLVGAFISSQYVLRRQTIEATDQGLERRGGKEVGASEFRKRMNWEDARLFARYTCPGVLGQRQFVFYELSSATTVISWRWVLDPRSPLMPWCPLVPVEEYHRQMQDLCELIVMKSGLPLYDVSEPGHDG